MTETKQIADEATLTIDAAWLDVGEGPEPIVRLLVDGEPVRAVSRAQFLALFDVTEAAP